MTIDELRALLLADAQAAYDAQIAGIHARFNEYTASQLPAEVVVTAGQNLQTALDAGGRIRIENNALFSGAFIVRTPGTYLTIGNGATITGVGQPAFRITTNCEIVGLQGHVLASNVDAVVKLGENTAGTPPAGITLRGLHVPTHRGRRGIEVHATDVLIEMCTVLDVYTPTLQDAQGIWIHRTPGNVTIRGGTYEADSENIMIGGDWMPSGVQGPPTYLPSNILIENVTLRKPLSWRTDGINRTVKNLFELKTGANVTLRNSILSGCWKDGQSGYALMLTPRNGGGIRDVLLEGLTITDVAAGMNVTGHNTGTHEVLAPTPFRTRNVVLRNSLVLADQALSTTSTGHVAMFTNGVESVEIDQVRGITNGSEIAVLGDDEKMDSLIIKNSHLRPDDYGINASGRMNGAQWQYIAGQGGFGALQVIQNVMSGGVPLFKTNFPLNTYLTAAEFDALFNPDWSLK